MKTQHAVISTAFALAFALPAPLLAQQLERDVPFLSDEITGRLESYSY